MKLNELKIENFRGIRSLELPLDRLTVLIGENNVGKSTVLEALRLVLMRGFGFRKGGRFTEYDFHLKDANSTPHTADPISIILHFAEETADEWPDAITQQLHEVIQLDFEKGCNHIWLKAKGNCNPELGIFETDLFFLDKEGEKLQLKGATSRNLISQFVPLFFLSAIRNASQEFGQRGQFWSGFLKSIELPNDQREEIEKMLQDINNSVIGANQGLKEVTNKISTAKRLVPLDPAEPVVLEAVPTRVFDMVGKIQVHLKSCYGAKLPLSRHGEGTQSLAVLMLFQAFAAANLAEAYAPESSPLLALEEPEAHLHPSAIRSLGAFFKELTGQILVTSHSGDLVSRVPITALRRLYKQNGCTKIGSVVDGMLTSREIQAIDYNICLAKGHYLFSRCWLFVEGESDYHLMPLLFELMGYSQDQVSFSVIEISQVIEKGEPLIKFAKALGVEWFLMADGDAAGQDYVRRASRYVDGEPLDRARCLIRKDIEHEFWYNGFDGFIENLLSGNCKDQIAVLYPDNLEGKVKASIKAAIKTVGGKPAFAQELVKEISNRGPESIPQCIQGIITRVVELAGD